MYIAIVARGYPNKKYPLNGIFELDQARALRALGHKVVYIALDLRSFRKRRRYGKIYERIDGIDIYTISLPIGPVFHKLFFLIGVRALSWMMKVIIRTHGSPDIIHSHFTPYSAIASSIKNKYNIPFVVTEHSSLINRERLSKDSLYWAKKAYSIADKIICVSSSLVDRIKKHFNLEAVVVPNIVDHNSFSYHKLDHDTFTYLAVGNLVEGKGYDILLKAFSLLKFKAELVIIGGGPLQSEIQRIIESEKLTGNVKLLGKKSRSEINKFMGKSDVFVLASRSETFGVVYIEAMMAGLPVIATKCGGPEDFVTRESGLLIPVNDPESLAEGMTYMYENLNNFDSKLISQYSKETFSSKVVAGRLLEIYRKVIDKNENLKRN